jgi:hypothetical protein
MGEATIVFVLTAIVTMSWLKIVGAIYWSWWLILSPIWVFIVFTLLFVLFGKSIINWLSTPFDQKV